MADHHLNGRVWLTRHEAADYARVSLSTIDRALRDGRLRRHRIDGGVRIKREHVDEWLHNGALVLLLVLVLALAALPLRSCGGHRAQHRHHHGHRGHHVTLAITAERASLVQRGGRRRRHVRATT
jgi:excisionase family DNA binding protein